MDSSKPCIIKKNGQIQDNVNPALKVHHISSEKQK